MDALQPRAEALAIGNGRVLAVGSNEDVFAAAPAAVRKLNAGGKMVLPGLQDTHLHLQDSGYYNGTMADLRKASTILELQESLRTFGEANPDGWLFGVGWYTGVFSEDLLDRRALDQASGDRPCLIFASDLHSICLNSAGCEAVGLVRGTAAPPNGHFSLYPDGTPTGMVHEEGIAWVKARIAQTTDEDFIKGVQYGQLHAHSHGLTGVIDAWVEERHCRVYGRMAEEQTLTIRVSGCAKVEPSESVEEAVARLNGLRGKYRYDMFNVHSSKFFLDGVLENRTAAMIDGYADALGGNAPLMFEPSQINDMFSAFDAERFQIHVHVIGDLAARAALDGLEHARRLNGKWPSHHQITHLQCVSPEDIPRLGKLDCVANIQALWARNEPSVTDVAVPMAGPSLANLMYPFRSILDSGALWTLSSDWGVSTLNPFQIMETAITRQPVGKSDHAVFLPEQRLTRHEALKGYTLNAATAAWRPHTGRLAPGCFGDFVVIDQDILACDTYAIGATRVLATYVSGHEVYRSPSLDF
nr:amidohydrolase [Shinella curvata]